MIFLNALTCFILPERNPFRFMGTQYSRVLNWKEKKNKKEEKTICCSFQNFHAHRMRHSSIITSWKSLTYTPSHDYGISDNHRMMIRWLTSKKFGASINTNALNSMFQIFLIQYWRWQTSINAKSYFLFRKTKPINLDFTFFLKAGKA